MVDQALLDKVDALSLEDKLELARHLERSWEPGDGGELDSDARRALDEAAERHQADPGAAVAWEDLRQELKTQYQ
jgi:putative addiction module component (TIGR02574 family)